MTFKTCQLKISSSDWCEKSIDDIKKIKSVENVIVRLSHQLGHACSDSIVRFPFIIRVLQPKKIDHIQWLKSSWIKVWDDSKVPCWRPPEQELELFLWEGLPQKCHQTSPSTCIVIIDRCSQLLNDLFCCETTNNWLKFVQGYFIQNSKSFTWQRSSGAVVPHPSPKDSQPTQT